MLTALDQVMRHYEGISQEASATRIVWHRRGNEIARAWLADDEAQAAPARVVLALHLKRRYRSARWTQVIEAAPGQITHQIELQDGQEIDPQLVRWLQDAWRDAPP